MVCRKVLLAKSLHRSEHMFIGSHSTWIPATIGGYDRYESACWDTNKGTATFIDLLLPLISFDFDLNLHRRKS